MKKALKVLALVVAMLFVFSSMALAATPITIYYTSGNAWVQAKVSGLKANPLMKEKFRVAQNTGMNIIVRNDDGSVVDWKAAIASGTNFATAPVGATAPTPTLELKPDGTEGAISAPVNGDANKATLTVTASGATVTSGTLDVVDLITTKVSIIMPGVNQVVVLLKSPQTTDGLTATADGSAMVARSALDGFYANVGASASVTVEITKTVVAPLDIVDASQSKIDVLMPGVNQAVVILKDGQTTDGVTATANGTAMTARTAKDGFYASVDASSQVTVILTKGSSTQTVTIN